MSSKHVFQATEGLVSRSLRGSMTLNHALALDTTNKVVYVREPSQHTQVAVISGGGAGHEPAHAGYTGRGMLSASVSGEIFASPSANQILAAIACAITGGDPTATPSKDVLVIINNYTGDRLNFGLAIEKAHILWPKTRIESVVVADDVSLLGTPSAVGPRGLAGNILVCKILGAYAEKGNNLFTVKTIGDAVVNNMFSIGVGLEHCHVPGRKKAEIKSAEGLIAEMVELLVCYGHHGGGDSTGGERRDEYAVFVNNLGGMLQLEMGAILDETLTQFEGKSVHHVRCYQSLFMTSLNSPGFSITILNISRAERTIYAENGLVIDIVKLLDAPTDVTSWPGSRSWSSEKPTNSEINVEAIVQPNGGRTVDWTAIDTSPFAVLRGIRSACRRVQSLIDELTEYDEVLGDGDCGDTFYKGAEALLKFCDEIEPNIKSIDLIKLVKEIGKCAEQSMGGTMGALFAIFFTAWCDALYTQPESSISLSSSINQAMETLFKYTPARQNDRTAIDALAPFAIALNAAKPLSDAAKAAREGAESTRAMKPRLGRAVYVVSGEESGTLPPDPGAWGVAAIVEGFCAGFQSRP
ncbi:DAK1/DegV-like protein [Pleurotus eryngii]|uniref:DAK1/DegV-like protein n=1 Tax=Pleurotus eryngii TaxID=5323 RepID=A0A9P6ABI1_PLEER|nr:DAK1/DegV-like protein [Pleurotus eryngii]